MKKILIAVLVLSIVNWLWCDLQEHYKKGEIVLKSVEGFGEENDWENLFYDAHSEITVAQDGSIFVINQRQHNIYKFGKNGNFIKKFGGKGEGPGDFYYPGDPTILDNKHLVVGEYGLRRRISILDFDGKCIKVVKTKKSCYYITALKENHVAYLTDSQNAGKKNGFQQKVQVFVKNIADGREKIIKQITYLDRSSVDVNRYTSTTMGDFFAGVYLAQTIDGNLAVGVSNKTEIIIYSPAGKILHSFSLKIAHIPVTKEYIDKFKNKYLSDIRKMGKSRLNQTQKYYYDLKKKFFKDFDFSSIFHTHLPLYKEILVDSEGNFLVFKYGDCQENCETVIQVYSKDGKFTCEFLLSKGVYHFDIDQRFKNIRFTKEGIIGLFMNRGDEDKILRLIKSNYSPAL